MKKEFIKGLLKKAGDKFEFIASDETKDRHGDVIPLDSWDLSNFARAPRMLVDHDHRVEKIVGKWEDVHIDKSADDGKGLKMTAVFHKITDLSKETMEMVAKGFLNTVSVGFIPHSNIEVDTDGNEVSIQRNELIEVSLVTVPANPNAEQIKSLLEKKEKEETQEKIGEFMGEKTTKTLTISLELEKAVLEDTGKETQELIGNMFKEAAEDAIKNKTNKDNQDELCSGCKKAIKNKIDQAPEIKNTPEPIEKSNKSRSFSKADYLAKLNRQALKEAVNILNLALSKNK